MASLVGIAGPVSGRHIALKKSEYVLGRGSSANIRLVDPGVSRQHARIFRERGVFEVEDLKSFNGTFVNGVRVQRLRLRDGDEVRICHDIFRFEADAPSEGDPELVIEDSMAPDSVLRHIDVAAISEFWDERTDLGLADVESLSRKLRAVAVVSEAVSTTLDPSQLFDLVLDQVLQSFSLAERASVLLRNEETGKLEVRAVRTKEHTDGFSSTGALAVSQTVIYQVMSEGHAVVAQPVPHCGEPTLEPSRCRMGAPIVFQKKIKGVIYVDANQSRVVFSEGDLDLLMTFAMQTAVALQIAEFHQKILGQQRLEQDLQFARRVQQGFLPNCVPEVPGFQFAAHYDPAFHVGGDFYDFITLDEHRLGVVLGDVAGHGVSAALFMARLSSHIRSFALTEKDPARVLRRTQTVLDNNRDGMFATILYLVLDTRTGEVVLSNAGHMPPILRRAVKGSVRSMDEVRGVLLGLLPQEDIEEHSFQLRPGETLLLFSDGLIEARNEERQEYGLGRLLWVCGQGESSAPALLRNVLKDFDRHIGGQDHGDDITMVVVTHAD